MKYPTQETLQIVKTKRVARVLARREPRVGDVEAAYQLERPDETFERDTWFWEHELTNG